MNTKECPYCHSGNIRRMHRWGFVKQIPTLRKYECQECRAEFMTFLRIIRFTLDQGISRLISLKQN